MTCLLLPFLYSLTTRNTYRDASWFAFTRYLKVDLASATLNSICDRTYAVTVVVNRDFRKNWRTWRKLLAIRLLPLLAVIVFGLWGVAYPWDSHSRFTYIRLMFFLVNLKLNYNVNELHVKHARRLGRSTFAVFLLFVRRSSVLLPLAFSSQVWTKRARNVERNSVFYLV